MLLSFLSTILSVQAAPVISLDKRSVIKHDSVQGFPETVPDRVQGQNYLRFQPYLDILSGCVPYPAVDSDGNTSAGLRPTGDPDGQCSSSSGQVYARSGAYNGLDAIMYSWYWPKDEVSSGHGHRHGWENAVVWINDLTSAEPTLQAVSASSNGNYTTETSQFELTGNRPLLRYFSDLPANHRLGFTSTQGSEQPLIAWECLSADAATALNNTDFGSAIVPFKDSSFQNNLVHAFPYALL